MVKKPLQVEEPREGPVRAVALRGLFWLLPIRIFWLQRILFHITEPAVREIRNGFGIQAKSWDPAFLMTCSVLMILWATAVRSGLHLSLSLIL